MPSFSSKSLANFNGVDTRLQRLFTEVVKWFDCSILGGCRNVAQQEADVAAGLSTTMNSRHLVDPATNQCYAVDVAPYPQNFDNSPTVTLTQYEVQMIYFSGFVKGVASQMQIPLRVGANFNGNNNPMSDSFHDWDHFEIPAGV